MNKTIALSIIAALGLSPILSPAFAKNDKSDQEGVRKQMRDGKALSLREIEGRVIPRMRGMEYLGPEYVSYANVYRLKFIDDGRVIFVDVDPRTGEVLRQR
jgi:hypothetical protein